MNYIKKNILFELGSRLSHSSLLFDAYANYRYKKLKIHKNSDICIEGFQRSGNSFLVTLFRVHNKKANMAHHIHSSIQVARAVHWKIPTVILIRKPEEAIASLLTWDANLSIRVALAAYRRFYTKVMPYKDKLLIGTFEVVTQQPYKIINEVNQQWQTSFNMPQWNAARMERFKQNINKRQTNALSSPVPNEQKKMLNQQNKEKVLNHRKYEKTWQVYQQFLK